MSKSVSITVNLPEAELLLSCLNQAESDGWYYGRKDQFEKRLRGLKQYVEEEIERAAVSADAGQVKP